jgi:exodeoxyribonuclease VII large subunit
MPEKLPDKTIFSLSEVAQSIQRTLAERYSSAFWIKAEMNKLNRYPQSGHCYPDLVERVNGKIVAEMRATIWKDDFDQINSRFLSVLKEPLRDGITILFAARVNFHPVYGLNLRIVDIDPSWSLGELERERQETIRKLKAEEIFDANRRVPVPLLPKRIAVISVQTSKGYADFTKVIDENPWGYRFFYLLFPALLQGDQAVTSILNQLSRIERVRHHFDAVAIIRGGGGDIGLTCFNNIDLARKTATFPIPVFTGIGHSTNETVVEMVACKNAITPTELADFLIQKFHNFSVPLNESMKLIRDRAEKIMKNSTTDLLQTGRNIRQVTRNHLLRNTLLVEKMTGSLSAVVARLLADHRQNRINTVQSRLAGVAHARLAGRNHQLLLVTGQLLYQTRAILSSHRSSLDHTAKVVGLLDPATILKRGYTMTLKGNRVIKSFEDIVVGDLVTTRFSDGSVKSVVNIIDKNSDNEQDT